MSGTSHWPSASSAPDPSFVALACSWMQSPAQRLLGLVWTAYDNMLASPPIINPNDLERSITQLLEHRIHKLMSGDEPFYMQHGPFERETMAPPPAQPPQYDLAFVLRADERVMWPLEAKVLETPGAVAEYLHDVNQEFMTCRYAPFSSSGAMLAYLLSGSASDALTKIGGKLGCAMYAVTEFTNRPHRVSNHQRAVPIGKSYPLDFSCHHLVLNFPGLKRHS